MFFECFTSRDTVALFAICLCDYVNGLNRLAPFYTVVDVLTLLGCLFLTKRNLVISLLCVFVDHQPGQCFMLSDIWLVLIDIFCAITGSPEVSCFSTTTADAINTAKLC